VQGEYISSFLEDALNYCPPLYERRARRMASYLFQLMDHDVLVGGDACFQALLSLARKKAAMLEIYEKREGADTNEALNVYYILYSALTKGYSYNGE